MTKKGGGAGRPEIFPSSPDRTLVRLAAVGRYRSGLRVWTPCPCSRNPESTVCGSAERLIPRTQFAVQPRFPRMYARRESSIHSRSSSSSLGAVFAMVREDSKPDKERLRGGGRK